MAVGINTIDRDAGDQFIAPVVTVTSSGFPSVWGRIEKHRAARSTERLNEASVAGAEYARTYMINQMQYGSKTGRKYKKLPRRSSRMNTNPMYTPEFPAEQSGELIRSLSVQVVGRDKAELTSDSPHAMWMEFGFTTKDGVIHYRPFMRTTIGSQKKQILDKMRKVIRGGG